MAVSIWLTLDIVLITQKEWLMLATNDLRLMLLELVNRPTNLYVSKKHLKKTCKRLNMKINYNKT